MKRVVFIVAVLVLSVLAGPPSGQTPPQKMKQIDRAAVLKKALASMAGGWQRSVWGQGSCQTGDAKLAGRRVWAVVMGCEPSMQNAVTRFNYSGFTLPALSVSGYLPDARVSATVVVSQVVGDAWIAVGAARGVLGSGPPWASRRVTEPGTYTVLGNPFPLEPDKEYKAGVWLEATDLCGDVCAAVATVTEIKWVF